MNGWYFVLGMISWQIIKMFALIANRAIIEHRQKKFLKLVNVTFPDKKAVTLISLDTSDRRAMAKLRDQLLEQFEEDEEPPVDIHYQSGSGFRN